MRMKLTKVQSLHRSIANFLFTASICSPNRVTFIFEQKVVRSERSKCNAMSV